MADLRRPTSTNAPLDMVKRELQQTAKLSARIRTILQKQLDKVEATLNGSNVPPEQRLKALDVLTDALRSCTANITACARILSKEGEARQDTPEENLEQSILGKEFT